MALALWLFLGLVVFVPAVEAGRADALVALSGHPPEAVARFARNLVARVGLILALAALVSGLGTRRLGLTPFFARYVGTAQPEVLGLLRFATASILFVSVAWEDVAGTAEVPTSMRDAHGLFGLVAALPGFDALRESTAALGAFRVVTLVVLAAAAVGLFSRVSVALGAAFYFVVAGLMRQPTWPYHTGLVPLYAMTVLALFRTGDGLSIDAWWRARRGAPIFDAAARAHYGWGRFAWVATLALPYTEAGLSKLCNGGPFWWEPINMRAILYLDSLNPMEFDFDLGLHAAPLPDAFFAFLGLSAVAGEVVMIFVLFSRRVRLVAPAVMMAMHVGILFLQNILFFDLIAMLAAVYAMAYFDRDGSPWDLRALRRKPASRDKPSDRVPAAPSAPAPPSGGEVATAPTNTYPRPLPAMLGVAAFAWVFAIELFPITAMQMYSHKRDTGVVDYYRITAVYADGRRTEERPEQLLPALRDGRYRRVLRICADADGAPPAACRDFLALLLRRRAPEGVRAYAVEHRRWDFVHHPDDKDAGEVVSSLRFDIDDLGPDLALAP